MVEEWDTMIHLETPEVFEESQDVEANFTCDTSPIVDFYLDLGASSHDGDRSLMSSFQAGSSSVGVSIASGARLSIAGKGTLCINCSKSVKHVLYVPG